MDLEHSFLTIFCAECFQYQSVPESCGNRFCPICSRSRTMKIRMKLKHFIDNNVLDKFYSYQHITLAIKNQIDLKPMIETLVKGLRKMRQRKYWKQNVKGGAFVVEITKKTGLWHAHLHLVVEAKWLDWYQIRTDWHACSGGKSVYIQRIPASQIVRYVTKYITKTDLSLVFQVIASEAIKGMRMFQPFGSWHNPITSFKIPLYVCPHCESRAWQFGNWSTWLDKQPPQYYMPERSPPVPLKPDPQRLLDLPF